MLCVRNNAACVTAPAPAPEAAADAREETMQNLVKILSALALLVSTAVWAEDLRPGHDWPMYGRNLRHTFDNGRSRINPDNVASLKPLWSFPTSDVVSASPTVVGNVVYVGAWDGYFYALDATSGALIWKFQVDCQTTILPVPPQCLPAGQAPPPRFFTDGGIITSTAAVVADRVYFAAGKTMYSLHARTGSLLWKHVICGNPDAPDCSLDSQDPTQIFSSPSVFDGKVFIGHTAGGTGYRGAIEALDASTGEQLWRFEVDPILDARGDPILDLRGYAIGGYNRGCGAVWSSAAVNARYHLLYFGTGDCNSDATPPYHEAVLALDTGTGFLRWAYRPRSHDTCDFDFGASPNLIEYADRDFVGIGGKDGTYYLLKGHTDDPRGELVWARRVVFGGSAGGFFGASFDGEHIFAATSLGDGNIAAPNTADLCDPSNPQDTFLQEPSMHALSVQDGAILWEQAGNHSVAPTSLANGVVFSGLIGIEGFGVNAYSARTGERLATIPMAGSVNSAATPLGETLFVTAGTSVDGSGGGVFAFALPDR
jgi:polyvinyl alcohol dehydrogenase (cytochrome)